jgi:hypothetical protein
MQQQISNIIFFFYQIPLYPGCEFTATPVAIHTADKCLTPTSMARALLLALFNVDTLLVSNLKVVLASELAATPACGSINWMKQKWKVYIVSTV